MEQNKVTSQEQPTTSSVISEHEKSRAAVNLPADQFQLGNRVFPIKDLEYDDYVAFVLYLEPLLNALVGKLMNDKGMSVPGLAIPSELLNATGILKFCSDALPEMVALMCKSTDESITPFEVKKLAKKPTVLAAAVMKQIKQNNMIKDFSDFFAQAVGILTTNLQPKQN